MTSRMRSLFLSSRKGTQKNFGLLSASGGDRITGMEGLLSSGGAFFFGASKPFYLLKGRRLAHSYLNVEE